MALSPSQFNHKTPRTSMDAPTSHISFQAPLDVPHQPYDNGVKQAQIPHSDLSSSCQGFYQLLSGQTEWPSFVRGHLLISLEIGHIYLNAQVTMMIVNQILGHNGIRLTSTSQFRIVEKVTLCSGLISELNNKYPVMIFFQNQKSISFSNIILTRTYMPNWQFVMTLLQTTLLYPMIADVNHQCRFNF